VIINLIGINGFCNNRFRWSEFAIDAKLGLSDYGNIFPNDSTFESNLRSIAPIISAMIAHNEVPLILGGDHSITYATTTAIASKKGSFKIVHFDAHPDLYENFEGNPSSHASPFARILEQKSRICSKLISVGIRTLNKHQYDQAVKYDVAIVQAKSFPLQPKAIFDLFGEHIGEDDQVYISFDMDCLDPAFAPGVSHREPGGLSTREAVQAIMAIPGNIVGADVVEYNPNSDIDKITATVSAKIVKEIIGRIRHGSPVM
jgi:arginase